MAWGFSGLPLLPIDPGDGDTASRLHAAGAPLLEEKAVG
jgi:hypothetical protein